MEPERIDSTPPPTTGSDLHWANPTRTASALGHPWDPVSPLLRTCCSFAGRLPTAAVGLGPKRHWHNDDTPLTSRSINVALPIFTIDEHQDFLPRRGMRRHRTPLPVRLVTVSK
jgi:hypothetical protein